MVIKDSTFMMFLQHNSFLTTFRLTKNETLSVSSSDHMARRKGDPFSYSSILKKKMNIIFKPGELGCQWYKVEQGVQWLLRHLGCSLPDDEKLRRGGGRGLERRAGGQPEARS